MTLAAQPYGRDTSATSRVVPGVIVEGNRLLAEAAIRRLRTQRGTLLYDPDYGLPLSLLLGRDMTQAELASIPGQIRNELLKDERLENVRASLGRSSDGVTWILSIEFYPVKTGPFGLVLSVGDVTVEVLAQGGLSG